MKNKIFKVCALGLTLSMLVSGCQNKEDEVKKINKNDEIVYSENNINDEQYYSVELYKFCSKSRNNEMFTTKVEEIKERYQIKDIDILTDEENVFEALITINEFYNKYKPEEYEEGQFVDEYEYILFIKGDTEYLTVFQKSTNSDKTNMKKIGEKIKKEVSENSNINEVYEKYTKDNDLLITNDVYLSEELDDGCTTVSSSTNSKVTNYTGTNTKVETVELDMIDLSTERMKVMVVAKNSDKKAIWSFDIGDFPRGIDFNSLLLEKTDSYIYYSIGETLEARDIQTGKIVWTSNSGPFTAPTVIEHKNKLYIESGMGFGYDISVIDVNNGKLIKKIEELDEYVKKENTEDEYYNLNPYKMKIVDDEIVINVDDYDDYGNNIGIVGSLKISTNDYSVRFEKN